MAPQENGISIVQVEGLPQGLAGQVHVKTTNGEEFDAYQARIAELEEAGKNSMRKCCAFIAAAVCDAEGKVIWTEDQAMKLSKNLIAHIFGAALAHNGVAITKDEAKKD